MEGVQNGLLYIMYRNSATITTAEAIQEMQNSYKQKPSLFHCGNNPIVSLMFELSCLGV